MVAPPPFPAVPYQGYFPHEQHEVPRTQNRKEICRQTEKWCLEAEPRETQLSESDFRVDTSQLRSLFPVHIVLLFYLNYL